MAASSGSIFGRHLRRWVPPILLDSSRFHLTLLVGGVSLSMNIKPGDTIAYTQADDFQVGKVKRLHIEDSKIVITLEGGRRIMGSTKIAVLSGDMFLPLNVMPERRNTYGVPQ